MRRYFPAVVMVAIVVGVLAAGGACFAALQLYDDFSSGKIDDARWVIDNDSGYELKVTGAGQFCITGEPKGADGPCDSIATQEAVQVVRFDMNVVSLSVGDGGDNTQMGAVYLASTTNRDTPMVVYGLFGDEKNAGKLVLGYRLFGSGWVELTKGITVLESNLNPGEWHNFQLVYRKDAGEVDLYFDGFMVATLKIDFYSGPYAVFRSGVWGGMNSARLEVLYDNIYVAKEAPGRVKAQ